MPDASAEAPLPAVKVGLISLGCPKNLVDSERMLGQVTSDGAVLAPVEEADIVVVNTCGFVEAAKQESIGHILEMLERKRRGQLQRVVVTGCLAQRYANDLRTELPEVDALVGVTREDEVSGLIRELQKKPGPKKLPMAPAEPAPQGGAGGEASAARRGAPALPGPRVLVADPTRPFEAETGRLRLTPAHYAYLRVAEGCDHACTFCAIPSFRGRFRSKPIEAILEEARELALDGAVELCLIAEDTNQYGHDRRDGASLSRLLRRLDEVPGVRWLRILYAYPAYFPDELIDTIAELEKVVPYIDIPLQHIADPVLRAMRRPSRAQTEALLAKLRDRIPRLTLRTTMITGFPGETATDHEELVRFVRDFRFERLGAFAYSQEDGTDAATLAGQLPPEVREARRAEVLAVQQEVAFERNRSLVGQTVRAIVDAVEAPGRAIGRTEGDAPDVDGSIRLYQPGFEFQPGQILSAEVQAASGYDLEAAPIAAPGRSS